MQTSVPPQPDPGPEPPAPPPASTAPATSIAAASVAAASVAATPSQLAYVATAVPGASQHLGPRATELGADLRGRREGIACGVVAVALWGLRAGGAISLEVQKGRTLRIFSWTDLVATRAGGSGVGGGAEAQLLQVLDGSRGSLGVGRTVDLWFGSGRVPDPRSRALGRLMLLTVDAGLAELRTEDAGRNRITGAILGRTKQSVHAAEAAVAAAAPAVEQVAEGWLTFVSREPELAAMLLEKVRQGIDAHERHETEARDPDD